MEYIKRATCATTEICGTMSGKTEDNSAAAAAAATATAQSMMTLTLDDAKQPAHSIKQIWEDFEADPSQVLDKEFTLFGLCFTEREQGKKTLQFVELMDGSTVRTLQCVCKQAAKFADWSEFLRHCTRGATVELTGILIKSPKDGQPIELQVSVYKCLGAIEDPGTYFMGSRGFISRETLRQDPHQRHHTKLFLAIQLLKQCAYRAFHEAMSKLGIGEIQPTLLTGNECEEGAHPFTVTTLMDKSIADILKVEGTDQIDWSQDFFHKHLYLTVSSQLHLEATVLGTRHDGYCMTTAFRAEPSSGPLHLAEFLMPEWELVGGQCSLERNMAVAQAVLQYVFQKILSEYSYELEYLEEYRKQDLGEVKGQKLVDLKGRLRSGVVQKKDLKAEKRKIEDDYERMMTTPSLEDRLTKYATQSFVVTTHAECVRLMLQHEAEGKIKFDETPGYSDDFTKQHEFYITEVLYGGMPVFVRYYPKAIKAFYMPVMDSAKVQSAPTDGSASVEYVDCYDLLFPYVGEVVGGSQRIDDAGTLVARMEELGMDTSPESELDWYVQLRRDASLPHGGAGLGFGRMMIAITGVPNIRDLQEFPRGYGLSCKA